MSIRRYAPLFFLIVSCGGTKQEWARDLDLPLEYRAATSEASAGPRQEGYVRRTIVIREGGESFEAFTTSDAERGRHGGEELGVFRNTYYDFPADRGPASGAALYDTKCRKIADVSQRFHDAVCVQGSGRLSSGQTVSFARRDCECASICPRTNQRICFEPCCLS